MTEQSKTRQLARHSQNFGYLLGYEPLLVTYGAGAEAYVFTDPNAALVKCRQFMETLTRELMTRLGLAPRRHLATDIAALDEAGVMVPRVRAAFDQIRELGNKATHHHLSDEQRALESLRHCFGLGLWFHRALSDDREVRAFVPPEPPPEGDPGALSELQSELEGMRAQLTEAQTRLTDATSREAAEIEARREAEEMVRRASTDRDEALALVRHLESVAEAASAPYESLLEERPDTEAPPLAYQTSAGPRAAETETVQVSPATRERIVERAREPEPLNEVEARRLVDRMLAQAGWVVQDFDELNPLAGPGVACGSFPWPAGAPTTCSTSTGRSSGSSRPSAKAWA